VHLLTHATPRSVVVSRHQCLEVPCFEKAVAVVGVTRIRCLVEATQVTMPSSL
jgi:hypothetical protein